MMLLLLTGLCKSIGISSDSVLAVLLLTPAFPSYYMIFYYKAITLSLFFSTWILLASLGEDISLLPFADDYSLPALSCLIPLSYCGYYCY